MFFRARYWESERCGELERFNGDGVRRYRRWWCHRSYGLSDDACRWSNPQTAHASGPKWTSASKKGKWIKKSEHQLNYLFRLLVGILSLAVELKCDQFHHHHWFLAAESGFQDENPSLHFAYSLVTLTSERVRRRDGFFNLTTLLQQLAYLINRCEGFAGLDRPDGMSLGSCAHL